MDPSLSYDKFVNLKEFYKKRVLYYKKTTRKHSLAGASEMEVISQPARTRSSKNQEQFKQEQHIVTSTSLDLQNFDNHHEENLWDDNQNVIIVQPIGASDELNLRDSGLPVVDAVLSIERFEQEQHIMASTSLDQQNFDNHPEEGLLDDDQDVIIVEPIGSARN